MNFKSTIFKATSQRTSSSGQKVRKNEGIRLSPQNYDTTPMIMFIFAKKNLFHATLLDIIHRLLHSCCPPFSHVVPTLSYLHAGRIIQFQLCASHVLSFSLTYMSSSVTGSRFVLGPHFFLFLKGQFRQNVDIPPPVFWHHISAMSLHISAMSHSISAISLHISAMNPSISTNEPPHISKVLLCNS